MSNRLGRRSFLKTSAASTIAAASLGAIHEAWGMPDPADRSKESAKGMPKGKIGKVEISRLICGSNPFYGGAHSRDLIYVSKLLAEYCTQEKIFDTLELCEKSGINTMIEGESLSVRYRKERGGKLQGLAMVMLEGENVQTGRTLIETTQKAIDLGVVGAFIRGAEADRWVQTNKLDLIEKFLSLVRKNGLIAGIGAHDIRVPVACEQAGLKPDFHFKTFHHDHYYSALSKEKRRPFLVDSWGPDDHDCIWEQYPEETIEFMKQSKIPWIAFKVLAAGAIRPEEGFRYAFQHGADFLAVGMLDFWVRQNVEIANQVLSEPTLQNRPRQWA
jgi:hypothetical protein